MLGFVALSGCVRNVDAPCRDQVIAKVYAFSDSVAAVMPFSRYDTLVYAAAVNDTLYLTTSSYTDSTTVQLANQPNNPECPNDFESHAIRSISVLDSIHSFDIRYRAVEQSGLCTFSWGLESLILAFSAIGARDSTFLDSVVLGNTQFYNVNQFTDQSGSPLYIHPTLGLLQLMKDQKIYTLQRFNSKPWK
jgi:hypothetical protein